MKTFGFAVGKRGDPKKVPALKELFALGDISPLSGGKPLGSAWSQ
jgi:hypothetical protein